jgi:peptide/nickel transport system substrate-binding protein
MLSRPDCGGTGIIHRSSVGADGSWKAPIGTGPYKLGEWKRGQYLELKRFDKYQARSEPASGYAGGKKAEVDTIRFLVVPDSASAKAALLGGSVDILPDVNESELADIQSKSNIKVDISTTPGISGILFNTRDPVMRDVRIRRAIALAIDGKELVSGTTNDLAKLNNSAMPSISPFYTEVQRTGFVPNIAEAKRLLKEAGYNGRPIKILANKRYGTMYDTALIAQGLAAYAGIRLEVEVLDWATQLDRYTRGNYQMMAFAYTSRLDPSLVYDMLVGPKATQTQKVWDNAEVQALVAESMRETDKAKRQAIFDELHRRMLQDVPLIVYWNGIQITAYHKRVVGFRQWPMEHPRYWLVRMKP